MVVSCVLHFLSGEQVLLSPGYPQASRKNENCASYLLAQFLTRAEELVGQSEVHQDLRLNFDRLAV